jgi:endoglycosylceramidase
MEQLGYDVMRVPVSWSALEPHPRMYSAAFLARLNDVLTWAGRHGIYVFVDMHQDGYSKEIGEDGAPLWAIVPPPTQLLEGPSDDSRRTTQQVLDAGFSFFANAPATDGRSLQDAFVEAVQVVARATVGNAALLGFEAFNEPVVLREDLLQAFHEKLADGIHAVDADAPMLFEPVGTRNQTDQAIVPQSPWSHGPAAYAPHIYTAWFSLGGDGWKSEDPSVLLPSMQNASNEAAGWGTPLFVTELGCDQSVPQGPLWLSAELDLQDRFLASSTAWEWEDPGSWSIHSAPGVENVPTVRVTSRTYPRAVAGDLVAIERPAPGHLVVHYRPTDRTRGLPHEVSMSADYATGYHVSCDGAPVAFDGAPGRATFTCPATDANEHTFEVAGTLN